MNQRDEKACRNIAASSIVGIPVREALAELDALREAVKPFAKAFETSKYGDGVSALQWRALHRAAALRGASTEDRGVKTRRDGGVAGGGMGWFFRGATEHVLFGVKGNKPIPAAMRRPNVVMAETGAHSEKPVEFYELLRGLYPADERMIDLYARRSHDRFDAWGNEAPDVHGVSRNEESNG